MERLSRVSRAGRVVALAALTSLPTCISVPPCLAAPVVTATEADDGTLVRLKTGDVFDIVLPSNYPKTGCQWRDEDGYDWKVLRPLGSRYEPQRTPPGGGDPGTGTHRFKAVGPGTVHVALLHSDNAGKECDRFGVDVTVAAPSSIWNP